MDRKPSAENDARLRALLEEFGARLRATIRRLVPRKLGIEADDVEQEARIRVWRALTDETNIERPASYLYRVAVSATIDAVRRLKARRERPLEAPEDDEDGTRNPHVDPTPSPERQAQAAQLRRALSAALRALEPNRRRAVSLYLRGFGTQEIALLLGWSQPKARNLVYRGLEDLRQALRSAGIHE